PPRAWATLTLSGLATGASWWCYFRALQAGDAARVAPLDKLSVVLVALFAVAFLGERLAPLNWLGVVMMATGAGLVSVRPCNARRARALGDRARSSFLSVAPARAARSISPDGCRRRDSPARPCVRPRLRVPGVGRSCASHQARSGRPCVPQRRQDFGPGRNCASGPVRSDRPCARPPRPAGGSARNCASHPVLPCRPCSQSDAAARRSSRQSHGGKCALHRWFLVPSLLLLKSALKPEAMPGICGVT